jgi:ABC-type nitrate/sulfonate/bicarbonate transport system permease component
LGNGNDAVFLGVAIVLGLGVSVVIYVYSKQRAADATTSQIELPSPQDADQRTSQPRPKLKLNQETAEKTILGLNIGLSIARAVLIAFGICLLIAFLGPVWGANEAMRKGHSPWVGIVIGAMAIFFGPLAIRWFLLPAQRSVALRDSC